MLVVVIVRMTTTWMKDITQSRPESFQEIIGMKQLCPVFSPCTEHRVFVYTLLKIIESMFLQEAGEGNHCLDVVVVSSWFGNRAGMTLGSCSLPS